MNDVVACIDGSAISTSICDAAAWACQRLNAPLRLLHVLDKAEQPTKGDLSGNIGLGSREHLLEELTTLDEKRARLALEHGRLILDRSEERARADGILEVRKQQRHGGLVQALLEIEAEARLVVMGRLGAGHYVEAHAVGSHIENVARTVQRPLLIAVQSFTAPTQFMIAYDGSETSDKALAVVARSPLLKGLPCHLVMVDEITQGNEQQMNLAVATLKAAGFDVTHRIIPGEVQPTLKKYQSQHTVDLLVMGAYGHSRIRQLLVGSNTTRMIGLSDIPLLLLR